MLKIISLAFLLALFQPFSILKAATSGNSHESSFTSLSALTDRFSSDVSKDLTGQKLYFDNACVREVSAQKTSNFSLYLQNELESSFSRNGFTMVYEPVEADYLIGANYQILDDRVRVFFKYHQSDLSGKKSAVYEILKANIAENAFEESIQTKAYDLASNILSGQKPRRIYVRPLLEGRNRYKTDFSTSFTSRIKCAMVKLSKGTEIIDEKPYFQKASGASSTRENAVLDGTYFDRGSAIFVHLNLRNLEGRLLSSSVLEIDKSLIQASTENKTAKRLLDFLDQPKTKGDFYVKISTPKGKDYPIYSMGEKIFFHIQVADPFYVYLYAINSKGKVSLLYPYKREGSHRKFVPGKLYIIPEKDGGYEIEVKPPFGIEAMKVFASSVAVSLPELMENKPSKMYNGGWPLEGEEKLKAQQALSRMKRINPRDLLGFFRGVAAKTSTPMYEDCLLLETRGN